MPAGKSYPTGHVESSPFWGLAYDPIFEISVIERVDFSTCMPLGTFLILPNLVLLFMHHCSSKIH